VRERIGKDVPYWILNAGHKKDFTAKAWDFDRYQELVDRFPSVWFAQVGAKEHVHPPLRGDNLLNFVGATDTRQMIRLVYNSFGVISGVSFPMHPGVCCAAAPEVQTQEPGEHHDRRRPGTSALGAGAGAPVSAHLRPAALL
jgi:hypothetical protein